MTAKVMSTFLPQNVLHGEQYLRGTTWRCQNGKSDGHSTTIERMVDTFSNAVTAMDKKGRSFVMALHSVNRDVHALFSLVCEDIHMNLKRNKATKTSQESDQAYWATDVVPLVSIRSLITSHPYYRATNGLFRPAEEWKQRLHLNQLEQNLIDYLDRRGWQIGMC